MCSLEKLKELAVSQMRAAADLYEVCEKAEKEMKETMTPTTRPICVLSATIDTSC